jgi:hypothetical protein
MDGIKKHFMVPDMAALLAKLFNPLAVTGGYPKIWKRNKTIFVTKSGRDLTRANR